MPAEALKGLAKQRAAFCLRFIDNVPPYLAVATWDDRKVAANDNGLTGYVQIKGNQRRVHVCAHQPCTARHSSSRHGFVYEIPNHVLWEEGAEAVAALAAHATSKLVPQAAAEAAVADTPADAESPAAAPVVIPPACPELGSP